MSGAADDSLAAGKWGDLPEITENEALGADGSSRIRATGTLPAGASAYQTASCETGGEARAPGQLDTHTFDFLDNLLGDDSIGINGGYEEAQAKSLQDCATGHEVAARHEPATATSKSASKTLPTHADDILQDNAMQDDTLETQQHTTEAGAAAAEDPPHNPLAEGVAAARPAQSDGINLFEFSTSVADVDAPTSDNGKYVDASNPADDRCAEAAAALPSASPSVAADGTPSAYAAEAFHSEHGALPSIDMPPLQGDAGTTDMTVADRDHSHPLVVNDLGWHDWRLNESAPLVLSLIHI